MQWSFHWDQAKPNLNVLLLYDHWVKDHLITMLWSCFKHQQSWCMLNLLSLSKNSINKRSFFFGPHQTIHSLYLNKSWRSSFPRFSTSFFSFLISSRIFHHIWIRKKKLFQQFPILIFFLLPSLILYKTQTQQYNKPLIYWKLQHEFLKYKESMSPNSSISIYIVGK